MYTTKVNLYVTLQGRRMYSKEEVLKTTSKGKVVEDNTKIDTFTMKVQGYKKPEVIHFTCRKNIPITQSLSITKLAYLEMISNTCPYWVKPFNWKNMSKKQRLESHLERIMQDLKGLKYTYYIFED